MMLPQHPTICTPSNMEIEWEACLWMPQEQGCTTRVACGCAGVRRRLRRRVYVQHGGARTACIPLLMDASRS